jgi:ubiquinone/menaquinone biosynthesis C-methylase UbiE
VVSKPQFLDKDGVDWQWHPVREPSDFYDSLVQAALRHVPTASLVLEIGVGAGYLLAQLAARAECSCVGVDLLPGAMEAAAGTAATQGVKLRLLRGSGFALPFPDSVFDVVMSHGVIEHFSRTHARCMLAEHARVCRPGGLVIVSVPNMLDVLHSIRKLILGKRYPYYPERSHSRWSLARELRAVGLAPRSADGYAPLWSLRQIDAGYPMTLVLHKTGLLKTISGLANPTLLSLVGNLTLQVAHKPRR